MIKYATEKLDDTLIEELKGLMFLQQIELALHKPLDLDWQSYYDMQKIGIFILYTARDEEELVGYSSFIVAPDHHRIGDVVAIQDSVFVLPAQRKKGVGIGIMKYSENELLNNYTLASIKIGVTCEVDFSSILERKGYEFNEMAMVKRVG